MTISSEVLTRARNGVCAIGYLRVSLDEYAKAPRGQARLYRYGPILQQGYISAIAPFDNSVFVERILLDLRTSVGMSGAPVFDSATGSVIGIHEGGRDATTAFAIPLNQRTITTLAEAHTLGEPSNVALPMVTRHVRPKQDPDMPRV